MKAEPSPSGDSSPGVKVLLDERAELLLTRLRIFFGHRLSRIPDRERLEDYAQETLARVVQRVNSGDEIQDLEAYTVGVAKKVFQEFLKRAPKDRRTEPLAESHDRPHLGASTDEAAVAKQETCLDYCLGLMEEEDRVLFIGWHSPSRGAAKVKHHREMQQGLGDSSALRVRIFRIKQRLKICCAECFCRETKPAADH